jgi:hypothetical protein
VFRDYPSFKDSPHAEGRLGLNPLYVEERRDKSVDVHFRRTFPTAFFEEENADCKQYLPESVSLNSSVVVDVAHGNRTPEIEKLIKQCVILGMPERYQRISF